MQRAPLFVAAAIVLASAGWAFVLVFGSGPLADSAAALLAADLLILGTVIAMGVALGRGRWTRRASSILLGGQAVVGVFFEMDGWWIGAVLLTAVGIAAVAGPWLDSWLRRVPRTNGPPPTAVIMNLGLVGLPTLVAATASGGVPVGGWMLSGFALTAAWAYSQAWLPALWAVRISLPVLGVAAAAGLAWPGALMLGLGVSALTVLAWSPDVRQATLSQAPTRGNLIPIPPELAPPQVLEAAGLDDRGRPRQPGET
ncbi:MAG: hypothetical protein OEM81_13065 [Acidimicrobiia bacterium]|nr:hypothetical protein [Acidimicrobiia bacterium]MDH3398742.1 hypothetical protein [Acidimicrobiia bacterium]